MPHLPEDVMRIIFGFVPHGWLAIDTRLALGILPGRLTRAPIDHRRRAVIRNRDGGRTIVLYARNDETKKWKTILVDHNREHDFVGCRAYPFYYPKYELL
ncbi:hypothetical protein EBZ80_01955 [bacterium]|nr:hypothetical protein [bacterium]